MSDNMNLVNENGNGNQQQQIEVAPNDLTFVECDCGSTNFRQGHKMGRLSKVHPKNPTGNTQIIQVPVTVCMECDQELDNQKLAE